MKLRKLGHPLIALACALWLGVDAWNVQHVAGSLFGNTIFHTLHRNTIRDFWPEQERQVVLVPEGDGFIIGNADGKSYDEMKDSFAPGAGVLFAVYIEQKRQQCLWVPAVIEHRYDFDVVPLVDQAQEALDGARAKLAPAREAFARWLEEDGYPTVAADVRLAPRTERIFMWGNIARNTAAALMAMLLLVSLAHCPRWVREYLKAKRERTWASGTCPSCGYHVEAQLTCPECGSTRPPEQPETPA